MGALFIVWSQCPDLFSAMRHGGPSSYLRLFVFLCSFELLLTRLHALLFFFLYRLWTRLHLVISALSMMLFFCQLQGRHADYVFKTICISKPAHIDGKSKANASSSYTLMHTTWLYALI